LALITVRLITRTDTNTGAYTEHTNYSKKVGKEDTYRAYESAIWEGKEVSGGI